MPGAVYLRLQPALHFLPQPRPAQTQGYIPELEEITGNTGLQQGILGRFGLYLGR